MMMMEVVRVVEFVMVVDELVRDGGRVSYGGERRLLGW
jgi:hypothetical protein